MEPRDKPWDDGTDYAAWLEPSGADQRSTGERAARVLNALVDQYLAYRRQVFRDNTPAIRTQRAAFEDELG